MSLIKERIKEVAVIKGIPLGKFFKKLEVAPSGFSGEKIKNGTNSETIEKLVSLFPDVDLQWLITGKEQKKEMKIFPQMEKDSNNYRDKYIELLEENRKIHRKLVSLLETNQRLKKHS